MVVFRTGWLPRLLPLLAAAALALAPASTRAALGERAASVADDQRALRAQRVAGADRGRYTVEAMTSGATTIREYVSPAGIVFAVAWNGVAHPDLQPLLGSYARDYASALGGAPRAPGKRRQRVRGERVVVERWGHMRDLHGRAYDPALLPGAVEPDEIR